jgi:hypothetical protein
MKEIVSEPLLELLGNVVGPATAEDLIRATVVPSLPSGPQIHRSVIAQAMNMALFARLLESVPDAQEYMSECAQKGTRIFLDHGALRTVINTSSGSLPPGQAAFTRILAPLGFEEVGRYPMPNLNMVGRVWCHLEAPANISQFFVSELDVMAFSAAFQSAAGRVVSSSQDPLTPQSKASLARLQESLSLPLELAQPLVCNLLNCFGRQHSDPLWEDYQTLLAESVEMAWIATEGNVFNHAADRVDDLAQVVQEQRALGRPMKETVEVSQSGTVRQTAYRAATVERSFIDANGARTMRPVPGSFFEFISRDLHPDGSGTLDLRFDAANAQGIFKMTQPSTVGSK